MFQSHHARKHTTADPVKDKFVVLSQPISLDENYLSEEEEVVIGDNDDSSGGPESSDDDQPGSCGQETNVTYEQIRYCGMF